MNVDLYLDGSALSDGREKEAVVATGVSFQNREGATSLITVSGFHKTTLGWKRMNLVISE